MKVTVKKTTFLTCPLGRCENSENNMLFSWPAVTLYDNAPVGGIIICAKYLPGMSEGLKILDGVTKVVGII